MKITKTASGKYKLTKQAWEEIGKKAGWIEAQKHPIYSDEVINAMEEIQKFIKENGMEAFRDLSKQIRRRPTSQFVEVPQKGLSGETGPG